MNERVLEHYKLVEDDFKKRFPDASYTMMLNIWDDGDFKIVAQHGDSQDTIHIVEYYSGEGSIIYYTEKMQSNAIKVDKFGYKYYIPNELIKYLNKETKENLKVSNK
jgi:hypothetical protein